MAQAKKGALMQVIFPMVDKTDFASIESAITASDFNSAATRKFFGVNHGGSAAFTSGTFSKAATLVHSGIFAQTIKGTEANYDYFMVRFTHPSCADQILTFQLLTNDDADIASAMSDFNSNLLSYLTGMSGMLSDIRSNVSDLQSDFQSRVPKAVATASRLLLVESTLSDVYSNLSDLKSDFHSRVPKAVATASRLLLAESVISDAHSAAAQANSRALVLVSLVSDVDSQLLLNASMISDVDSQLNVTASKVDDMENRISDLESLTSDAHSAAAQTNSRILLALSNISDIQSAIDSQFAAGVPLNASDMSDLRSAIAAVTAAVSASDMSDIASRVWATAIGAAVSSRIVLIQSNVSDIESQLDLNASMISDVQSALDSQFAIGVPLNASDMSDLRSAIGAITATLSASDMSDIRSAIATVGGTDYTSILSDIYSAAGQINSRVLVLQSNLSDVQSALDSQFVWTSNVLSDLQSDFQSRVPKEVANASRLLLLASVASDAHSAAAQGNSRTLVLLSNLSDVESQLDLNASMISDVLSALDSQFAAGQQLNASTLSDLRSAITAVGGTDYTSILSDIYSAAGQANSRVLVTLSNLSDVQSAPDSQFAAGHPLTASDISDLRSAITAAGYTGSTSTLSDVYSLLGDVYSNLVAGVTIGVSSLSDISSRVNAEVVDALNVDTYAEPSGAPAATTTMTDKVGRIYQLLRNKLTVTSSAKTLYADDGSVLWSKALTDDGTTYTEDEGA